MGAGLSREQIASRVRRRLHKLVAEHPGATYLPAHWRKLEAARRNRAVHFPRKGGEPGWIAWWSVGHASNGETFGTFHLDVHGPSRSGGVLSLKFQDIPVPAAVEEWRAVASGRRAWIVDANRAFAPGQSALVARAAVTFNLGYAALVKIERHNYPRVWSVAVLSEDQARGLTGVRVIREVNPWEKEYGEAYTRAKTDSLPRKPLTACAVHMED